VSSLMFFVALANNLLEFLHYSACF